MARSETATRALVALVGVPVALGAVYLGRWALAALLAAAGVLAVLELYRMAERKGARPLAGVGALGVCAWIAAATAFPEAGLESPVYALVVVLLVLGSATVAIWTRGVEGQPLLSISVTIFGALYAAGLSFALFLRHLPGVEGAWHGTALVFAPVLLTWANDTVAYFVGRAFGRRKLIPRVSPGKTVEGTLGAVVGTVAVAVAYSFVLARFPAYRLGMGEAVLLGVLVSAAAVVGDLAESLLKRDAGVKDSGALLPGHGGALDRFDSLLFTLPVAWVFFRYLAGP